MHRILPSAVRHGGLTKILGEAKQLASPPLKEWIRLAVCSATLYCSATVQSTLSTVLEGITVRRCFV